MCPEIRPKRSSTKEYAKLRMISMRSFRGPLLFPELSAEMANVQVEAAALFRVNVLFFSFSSSSSFSPYAFDGVDTNSPFQTSSCELKFTSGAWCRSMETMRSRALRDFGSWKDGARENIDEEDEREAKDGAVDPSGLLLGGRLKEAWREKVGCWCGCCCCRCSCSCSCGCG